MFATGLSLATAVDDCFGRTMVILTLTFGADEPGLTPEEIEKEIAKLERQFAAEADWLPEKHGEH